MIMPSKYLKKPRGLQFQNENLHACYVKMGLSRVLLLLFNRHEVRVRFLGLSLMNIESLEGSFIQNSLALCILFLLAFSIKFLLPSTEAGCYVLN